MPTIRLSVPNGIRSTHIRISGSKSETNRALLLQALYRQIKLENASGSDDSRAMEMALASGKNVIDVGHAGTAMRFLTAYFAATPGKRTLTGSARMKQRPIGILVDALRELGGQIEYVDKEGFPPLSIEGQTLKGGSISVNAGVSSQFLSALLLVAPKFENGLELTLKGKLTSRPYLRMTLSLLEQIGVDTSFSGDVIRIAHMPSLPISRIPIESDWSSASYFYSLVALSAIGTSMQLSSFKPSSFQGDRAVADIYRNFGVMTNFLGDVIHIEKDAQPTVEALDLNLNDTPDLAQTLAVTCLGLGIGCRLTGLGTLRIKETDRLRAMQTELSKFGASVSITDDSLELSALQNLPMDISVSTYDDHRMALAFAPLAAKVRLSINNPEVVSKSYPEFWEDFKTMGGVAVKSL